MSVSDSLLLPSSLFYKYPLSLPEKIEYEKNYQNISCIETHTKDLDGLNHHFTFATDEYLVYNVSVRPWSVGTVYPLTETIESYITQRKSGGFSFLYFYSRLEQGKLLRLESYHAPIKKVNEAEDISLKTIYDTWDNLLLSGNVLVCDYRLQTMNVHMISMEYLIGYLTVTLPWKDVLPSRPGFTQRVRELALTEFSLSRVNRLLKGLE